QKRFWPPISMRVPRVASIAAGRSMDGGKITISQWVAAATSGLNFWKNAQVSLGVLYIFQLPAMMGVRRMLDLHDRAQEACSLLDVCTEVVGHGLAYVG